MRERLAVNGSPVGTIAFADLFDRLRPEIARLEHEAPGDLPSFFEATTVMGFLLARERDCEAVVLEVGLGGRLDATNVVDPTACLITQIARDHTRILGDTVASIAREKAGIIKPGRPVAALGRPGSAAHKVISERASELGAPLVCEGQGLTLEMTETFIRPDGGPGLRLDGTVAGRRWQALELLAGAEHQAWNALLAIHGASLLLDSLGRGIEDSVVRTTLRELNLPARSEWFPGTPPVLLDGAHTQESVVDLTRVAGRLAGGRPIHVVCALTRDRDPARVLGSLAECAASLTATTIESPRGRPAEEVAEPLRCPSLTLRTEESPTDALKVATDAAGDQGIVVIAGSLYLAGSLRGLLEECSTPEESSAPEGGP